MIEIVDCNPQLAYYVVPVFDAGTGDEYKTWQETPLLTTDTGLGKGSLVYDDRSMK